MSTKFNAFIAPNGDLLKFKVNHDIFAKKNFHTTVSKILKEGFVRLSWKMWDPQKIMLDAHDLKASLSQIQDALLPLYNREGNMPVAVSERIGSYGSSSPSGFDGYKETDLATLTLGTFRDIVAKEPFGERDNPDYENFSGWVSPKGEKIPVWKDTHEELAEKLLTRYYDDWPQKSPIKGRRWTNSDALKMGGWIRASGTSFSVYELRDSVGRVQKNLVDMIAELPEDEMIFVDDYIDGDIIYNRSAGWFLDKYQ